MGSTWIITCGLIVAITCFITPSLAADRKDRPRNVTTEVLNATAAIIRWETPRTVISCPISKYIIRIKYDGQIASTADRAQGSATRILFNELRPDARYQVRVTAVGCRGKSPPTRWVYFNTPSLPGTTKGGGRQRSSRSGYSKESDVPGKPTQVRTRTLTNSIILSWEPPRDNILIRGYMVGYGEAVPDVNWQYVPADERSFTIHSLKPSSQYVISLRAFNNFGKGLVVYDLVYTREEMGPTVGPLSSPIGLRSRVLSPKTVWLEWTDPSLGGAQKITDDRYYVITYSEMPVGETASLTVKSLNVVVYDLTPAMTYEFRVKTRKGDEETVFGISVYNTTFEAAPATPPRSLTILPSNQSETAVSVSWLPPSQPNGVLTGYLIFYAEMVNDMREPDWIIEGVLGDIFHIDIEGFSPDQTYILKIQARNTKGYSPMSEDVVYRRKQVKAGPETPPRSLSIVPARNSSTGIVVTWVLPERVNGSITGYAISHQDAGEGSKFADVWEVSRAPANFRSIVLEGFRPDRTYNFRIQAGKGDGYGPMSSVVKYRRIDIKDINMYEDADVISLGDEGDSGPSDLPFKINLGLPDPDSQNDVPEPQFLRAPIDIKVDDRAKLQPPEENQSENEPEDETTLSAPDSVRTLIRHRVSAVLTWQDDVTMMTSPSGGVYYQIRYIRQGEGHHVLSQNSEMPVFLLENLHVGTRYMYNITMHSHNTNNTLWLKQGVVDTSEEP